MHRRRAGRRGKRLCFATMEQFKTLFDEATRGGLPLIVNFVNNFYGMGGQPVGETGGFGVLARMGAGLNPRADARRANRRLQSAGRDRCDRPQARNPAAAAMVRSCSTRSPTGFLATRRRMRRRIATRARSTSGAGSIPF